MEQRNIENVLSDSTSNEVAVQNEVATQSEDKYLVKKNASTNSLVSKIGAGLLSAVAALGGSNVEAGGYVPPSQEELSQINSKLVSLESEYTAKYNEPISLKYGTGEILWVDKENKRNPWSIRVGGGMFSTVNELEEIKRLPVFELAKLKVLETFPSTEMNNLRFTVEGSPATRVTITEYGYATLKVAGATINNKDGKLYSADGQMRVDFTENGKNETVEVYGKKNQMTLTVCTKQSTEGGVLQKAVTVELSGNYQVKTLSGANILDNCR